MKFLSLGVLALVLVSCGHTSMKGSVVMKVDDQTGYVCNWGEQLNVGDKVYIYRSKCSGTPEKGVDCKKEKAGDASITKILNSHYSEFKVSKGVKFKEGSLVEK